MTGLYSSCNILRLTRVKIRMSTSILDRIRVRLSVF